MIAKHNKTASLVTAALTLAGKQGWTAVTPTSLAKTAKTTTKEAAAFLASPAQTMRAIADHVTTTAQRDYRHDPRNSPREALFEILMLRVDVLQRHRAGFLALHDAARHDPRLATAIAQALYPQTGALLRAAHMTTGAPESIMIRAGLSLIYGATLCVWRRDATPDMAKTMATLDRNLHRAENLMRFMERRTG
ncbi:MAG: hypothetical protein WBK91_07655 [Alphaproteobacteria bacterium]